MHNSQYWLSRLDRLEETATEKDKLTTQETISWVSDSVAVFNALRVSPEIIRGFLRIFENEPHSVDPKWRGIFEHWAHPAQQTNRIIGFMNVGAAFSAARSIAANMEDAERFIPRTLIDLLQNQYPAIAATLENIEKASLTKDPNSMIIESCSLLDLTIQLNGKVPTKDASGKPISLKNRLNTIKGNKLIKEEFGTNDELLDILHNFRYLRNATGPHKSLATDNPHFAVGYGFASLVLLFLYGAMQKGVLIKV